MKKIRIISSIILFIAFLNVFAFMVARVEKGGNEFGILTEPIKSFSEFTGTVIEVLREFHNPALFINIDPNFKPVNNLKYDVFALNGHFENKKWIISLMNLKNDSLIHRWFLSDSLYKKTDRIFSHSEPRGPILLEDKSIIITSDESHNLYKLDKESNVIWQNSSFRYHHSINISEDGNIWACSRELKWYQNELNKSLMKYWDNSITSIDGKTGRTLFNKSVSEIFFENGLNYFIHGMSNAIVYRSKDPVHLNDIEPTLSDGPFWKKGDLFLSFRNRSLIVLYRPETNKVLRIIQGPFFNQHDVDIQSDSTISFFNNNTSGFLINKRNAIDVSVKDSKTIANSSMNVNSEVLMYNFKDSTFKSYLPYHFQKEKIFTRTEGLHKVLANGDLFVESQNAGIIYIFNEEDLLLKKYYNEPVDGLVQRPYWVRIYETLDFINTDF